LRQRRDIAVRPEEGIVQALVGGFLVKQAKDLLLEPRPPAERAEAATEVQAERSTSGDGETPAIVEEAEFTDEAGNALGRAFLVPGVDVWVIAERRTDRWLELARCLAEPASRVFFQQAGGRVSSVIYAADPERPVSPRAEGMRPDDV